MALIVLACLMWYHERTLKWREDSLADLEVCWCECACGGAEEKVQIVEVEEGLLE